MREEGVVDVRSFGLFLRRVFLGGIVESCVVIFKKGIISVQAVDMSNSVFLSCKSSLSGFSQGWELGLGNLDLLVKFLSSVEEKEVKFKVLENRLVLRRPRHGELRYLLTEADLIPTAVEDKGSVGKLVKQCDYKLPLTVSVRDDIVGFVNTVKTKDVRLSFGKEKAYLVGGADTEHQFRVNMGKVKGLGEPFELCIYGDHMVKVFDVLEFGEKEKPLLLFGDNKPLVVQQDADNTWALVHVSEEA